MLGFLLRIKHVLKCQETNQHIFFLQVFLYLMFIKIGTLPIELLIKKQK